MTTSYTLHHGDCLDVLRTLPDASVDAVITDPPYGGTTACTWDTVIPFAPMWEGIKRVLKPRGACVLFGAQPFTSALVMSNPTWFKYEWVWEKNSAVGFNSAKYQPMRNHESILVFYTRPGTYNPIRQQSISQTAIDRASRGEVRPQGPRKTHHGGPCIKTPSAFTAYVHPRTVQRFNVVDRHHSIHPTQKPLALLEYLVKTYTDEGDVVLDFTMGSGTTGHACVNLGRSFIGIEQDAGYFAIAEKRLADAAMQQRMALEDAPRTPCTSVLQ